MRCTATASITNASWTKPALPAMIGRSAKRSKVLAATNGHASVVTHAASMPLSSFHHSLGSRFVAPGLVATDHYVEVPLDYTDPMSEKITVFVREVIAPNRMDIEQPGLLYLQGLGIPGMSIRVSPHTAPGSYPGGPGFEGPRATEASAWVKSALMHFKVYLMDQRGTGLSSPITPDTLPKRGNPAEQAQYLTHFRYDEDSCKPCLNNDRFLLCRADSIVADAEVLRRFLVRQDGVCKGRWTVLGQSFGGFCALTYLSFAPHGVWFSPSPTLMAPCCAASLACSAWCKSHSDCSKVHTRVHKSCMCHALTCVCTLNRAVRSDADRWNPTWRRHAMQRRDSIPCPVSASAYPKRQVLQAISG